MPFQHYIWGDEHEPNLSLSPIDSGTFRSIEPVRWASSTLSPRQRQPSSPASAPQGGLVNSLAARAVQWLGTVMEDPALIGVLMTDPRRREGWFCLIGQWAHTPSTAPRRR